MESKSSRMNIGQIFALAFLFGLATASIFGLVFWDSSWNQETTSKAYEGNLLPDPDHITVVDESKYFTTQLQRTSPDEEEENEEENDNEALKNLNAALLFRQRGNQEKALKLFKHALVLSPKHPVVLNHYGEFLEDTNVVEADHLFVKAMAFSATGSEENSRALQNRKRTAVLVEELDTRTLKAIDDKKKAFQRINEYSSSLKRAKKEAYFQHIYHTVGIEGNTLTLAQTRSILETRLAVGGKSVMEHNEILGLDSALKYINQTLVDKPCGSISMKDILEIHRRVIGHVDPMEAGVFRRTQVFVGDYAPPHPGHIDMLMERFLMWLNAPETLLMHPVRMAALAHYKLVYIHPFVDGNGRTSRLLMNWILMQNGFPPVIIRKQDRLQYYQYLVTANDGDIRPFVRFIAGCTARTLDAYLAATKQNSLVPFGGDDEIEVIPPHDVQEHLDYHDKIIMGGMVGINVTVEP